MVALYSQNNARGCSKLHCLRNEGEQPLLLRIRQPASAEHEPDQAGRHTHDVEVRLRQARHGSAVQQSSK